MNKNEYAYTKEKVLSLLYDFQIYNMKDEEIYTIEEDLNLLVGSYTITKTKDSNLDMEKVVYLTCIVDAIRNANK